MWNILQEFEANSSQKAQSGGYKKWYWDIKSGKVLFLNILSLLMGCLTGMEIISRSIEQKAQLYVPSSCTVSNCIMVFSSGSMLLWLGGSALIVDSLLKPPKDGMLLQHLKEPLASRVPPAAHAALVRGICTIHCQPPHAITKLTAQL